MTRLFVLPFTVMVVASCGQRKGAESAPPPAVQEIFVHGDPMQLITGANLNGASFIETHQVSKFSDFALVLSVTFQKQSAKVSLASASTAAIEARNQAQANDLRRLKPLVFHFVANGSEQLYRTGDLGTSDLRFEDNQGHLVLRSVYGTDVQPLSYSVKEGGEAFSILFRAKGDVTNPALTAMYFVKLKSDAKPLPDVSTDFHYLMGPGVITKWESHPSISICGSLDSGEEALIRAGIKDWLQGDSLGQTSLLVERVAQTVPFTDLNTNCVMVVDDYLFENTDESSLLGITYPVIDFKSQAMVSAHIMISRKALTKRLGALIDASGAQRPDVATQFTAAVTHEVGHFLGLDHEFARNDDGSYKFPSIMSYDHMRPQITAHDRASITNLYGPYP